MGRRLALLPGTAVLCALLSLPMASADGPAGMDEAAPEVGSGVPVFGYVLWPGHDVSASQVRICADRGCREVVACAETTGPNGAVFTALDPGTYYAMAFCDQDGNGRIGPGDGLGFYGAYEVTDEPLALVVVEGAEAVEVNVPISYTISEAGRLVGDRVLPPSPLIVEEQTALSGVVGGVAAGSDAFAVLVPLVPVYPARASRVQPDGTFRIEAAPGAYHLLSVQEREVDGRVGVGDLAGVYVDALGGSTSAALLRVEAGAPMAGLEVPLAWAFASDGRLRLADGSALGPRLQAANLPGICVGVATHEGAPVEGALVQAFAGDDRGTPYYSTRTDAAGLFCLGLTAGTYTLTATRDDNGDGRGGPEEATGTVKRGDAAEAGALLVRPGSVTRGLVVELR